MSTLHNQLYGNLIGIVLYNHLGCFDLDERNTVYEGDDMPEGMYEPYMRIEIKANWVTEPMGRLLKIRFIAGTVEEPFQECCITLCPEIPSGVIITHPLPNMEYSMCHIFNTLTHWCVELMAEKEGLPSCCCPDRPDDHGHGNSCGVPDYSANDAFKPDFTVMENPAPSPPKADNVLPLKPRLRVVKNETPSDQG